MGLLSQKNITHGKDVAGPSKLEYNASVGSCQSTSKKTCTRELVLKHHFKSQERQSREKDIPARIT